VSLAIVEASLKEIETSACFSAMASLIPSPTKQTLRPSFCNCLMISTEAGIFRYFERQQIYGLEEKKIWIFSAIISPLSRLRPQITRPAAPCCAR